MLWLRSKFVGAYLVHVVVRTIELIKALDRHPVTRH
jgi:hypothetical protein